jgi:hypothetical protein
MHVHRGCRGLFTCNGGSVQCESWGFKHATCECTPETKIAQKFTVMGEGEFTLAQSAGFDVSACSADVSEGISATKKDGRKITWNRDFQVTDGGVQVMVDGGESRDYQLTITGSDAFTPYNLGIHTAADAWNCDPALKGTLCKRFMANDDVQVLGFRKSRMWDKHNGFNAYLLSDPTTIAAPNRKCRYQTKTKTSLDLGRLFRTQTGTLDACQKLCEDTEGCTRYSFGTDQSDYNGLCMGCVDMPIRRLTIKFPKTNRMVTANIATKAASTRFGKRTLFNLNVKVPETEVESGSFTGFCAETKSSISAAIAGGLTSNKIAGCNPTDTTVPEAEDTDKLLAELIQGTVSCTKAVVSAAVEACGAVSAEDRMSCLLDKIEGCDTDGIQDLLEFEHAETNYACPTNSYISTRSWPLSSFDDCTCMWGHSRDDEEESCTPLAIVTPAESKIGACFCDGTSPHHCMHNSDRSCGLPVTSDGSACEDPSLAMGTACSCGTGTTDCTGTNYFLQVTTQPSMATPKGSFGQQPVVKLVDAAGTPVVDHYDASGTLKPTKVRISIANAKSDECGCSGETPCAHDNDATCHEQYELFGSVVCPAGTTKCMPEQALTKLYQAIKGESASDSNSLEAKTTQCRTTEDMKATAGDGFCSGLTPCKHQNDGHCMQKTAFYVQKVGAKAVDKTCIGTAMWRAAVPSPVTGWFFETDATCSMDTTALGCTDTDHSYAMDKWCDHNCHPKYPGQPAFCPPSHCDCVAKSIAVAEPPSEWACPANQYDDGSCRCSPGTEFCGAIEVELKDGVASFEHLTIGTTGAYQLLVEVINPDKQTGSNNVRITTKTNFFDVTTPKVGGETCRAQPQWRKPNAWINPNFEDSAVCFGYRDGRCLGRGDTLYAMDKYCKSKNCADETLAQHCELFASEHCVDGFLPTNGVVIVENNCKLPNHGVVCRKSDGSGHWMPPKGCLKVPSSPFAVDSKGGACRVSCNEQEEPQLCAQYDMFGDCCTTDNVDACGVCGGDGSTCSVVSYITEPVSISGANDIIFDTAMAHESCDMKSPCMHLNDRTCGPKTLNSAVLIGDEHHCYWDRKATAAEQPGWKYGTWDVEGRLSKSIETQFESGNSDCYCPAGTIDISPKILIEEKAKEDFLAALTAQVEEMKENGESPTEAGVLQNSNAALAYDTNGCDGRTISLSSVYQNVLCGTHWSESGGKGSCATSDTCTNDRVRSIRLPAMTTAKIYKHCASPNARGQQQYATIQNFEATEQCFDLSRTDVSNIILEGAVLKLETKIIGTPADCFESQCMNYVEVCRAEPACAALLGEAEGLVVLGASFLAAIKDVSTATASNALLQNVLTCSGLHANTCDPARAASSQSTSLSTLKAKVPAVLDGEVVNPTHFNNPDNLPMVDAAVAPKIIKCEKPIMSTCGYAPVRTGKESVSYLLSSSRHRRLAAGTTTALVQVSSSGNQDIIGTTASSPAGAGEFAASGASPSSAAASPTANAAATGGLGSVGIALVTVGAVGIFAVGMILKRQQFKQAKAGQEPGSRAMHRESEATVV